MLHLPSFARAYRALARLRLARFRMVSLHESRRLLPKAVILSAPSFSLARETPLSAPLSLTPPPFPVLYTPFPPVYILFSDHRKQPGQILPSPYY